MRRAFVFVLLLAVPFTAVAEGEGKKAAIPRAFLDAAERLDSCFPLVEGYRWTYLEADGSMARMETRPGTKIEGVDTIYLYSELRFFHGCSALTSDGALMQHASGGIHDPDIHEPASRILSGSLQAGATWTVTTWFPGPDYSHSYRVTVREQGTVDVPAGRFRAWVVDYEWISNPGDQAEIRFWIAPGVGIVRSEELRESSWGRKRNLRNPKVHELQKIESLDEAHPADYPTGPQPIARLPAHIDAADNEVSLFADFDDWWQKQVVVYLINNTARDLALASQDSDPYLKLFVQDERGHRTRAQTHEYSSCGNSYFHDFTVPAGSFRCLLGWAPARGEMRKVRYQIAGDSEIVSNTGRLLIDTDEVARARFDAMALADADIGRIQELLFGPPPPFRRNELEYLRATAIRVLATRHARAAVPVLVRYLRGGQPSSKEVEEIIPALQALDPGIARAEYLAMLRGSEAHLRFRALQRVIFMVSEYPEIDDWIPRIARDPTIPVPASFYQHISFMDRHRHLLDEVVADERQPAHSRHMARFFLEFDFESEENSPLEIDISDIDRCDYRTGVERPGALRVCIRNRSRSPVTIRLQDQQPASLYAWITSPDQDRFLLPVEASPQDPATADSGTLVLQPDERCVMPVELFEWFDLAPWTGTRQVGVTLRARVVLADGDGSVLVGGYAPFGLGDRNSDTTPGQATDDDE